MNDLTPFRKISPVDFPSLLKEINDPPKCLYLEGDWPDDNNKFLAVVGSRRYSRYGQEACEELIRGLIGQPIVIVSGLAIGIDTIAHQTALASDLQTIAVPGSGLSRQVLHPFSNRRLADKIIEANGCLLSELEPKQPAGIHTFPRRNRLMAGLSHAVLIIEAGEKSGTLITARLAMEYNRELLVVPGSIFSPNSRGANALIKQGAMPINTSEDILEALGLENKEKTKQKNTTNLSITEQKIIDILFSDSLPRDELIEKIGLPVSEANALLLALEIKGFLKETMGEIRLT